MVIQGRGFVVQGTFPVDHGYKSPRSNPRALIRTTHPAQLWNEKDMNHAQILLRGFLLIALFWSCAAAHAQPRTPVPTQVTLQVDGLDSATRDALSRNTTLGSPRVVFACVPAGILVFESVTNESRSQLETSVRNAMTSRAVNSSRTRIINHSLAQAEAACAETRNR